MLVLDQIGGKNIILITFLNSTELPEQATVKNQKHILARKVIINKKVMLTLIMLFLIIVGAVIAFGFLRKSKEIDKTKSDGTIHPKSDETVHPK
jgi:hypothetical protein